MLYFRMNGNEVAEIAKDGLTPEQRKQPGWVSRSDFPTFDAAQHIAGEAFELTGELYLAVDNGPHVSPRYDVIEAPKVGDKVSRGFNGDYYPAGTITKISDSYRRVETDDGTVFWRRKQTGGWKADGVWWMVEGHHNELNPHF